MSKRTRGFIADFKPRANTALLEQVQTVLQEHQKQLPITCRRPLVVRNREEVKWFSDPRAMLEEWVAESSRYLESLRDELKQGPPPGDPGWKQPSHDDWLFILERRIAEAEEEMAAFIELLMDAA